MTDKVIENNQVAIMGEIVSDFSFSHEIFGEGFYMVDISVDRLSESTDIIPVMVSERLIDVSDDYKGMKICVTGQFRSYNRHEERKNRLVLSVFAREIEFVEDIGRRRLAGRLRICCLRSTGLMANRTTYLVSVGDATPGLPVILRWAAAVPSGAGSRAVNI